jgi:hypothetical protein
LGDAPEIVNVVPGLWLWRHDHPDWDPSQSWKPRVASTVVDSGAEVALLDPLAPPPEAKEIWARLDVKPPTMVVVLKPDHVRDVDLFVNRYNAKGYGPWLYHRDKVPETELELVQPGIELPGGLMPLYEGRGRAETPLWLPEQRALVFADGLIEKDGELRIWETPWHEQRAVPALRAMLELPFELVIVSHGEPVHDRAAFERALELAPLPVRE